MFKISKRNTPGKLFNLYVRFSGIILAVLVTGLFIAILGHNPIEVFSALFKGAFGSEYRFIETIIKTIPLAITSIAVGIAFKMKFWNIGAEGQIIMGACFSSFVALTFTGLSKPLMLPLMMIAGIIGGGIWALIPAFFKAKFNTNETIFTLMMKYIALKWVVYLQYGPWKDPRAMGFPKIPNFVPSAVLPEVFGIHIGWIIMLVVSVVFYFFINHSKLGYEIKVVGESENTARYAGISVIAVILINLFISGGLAGLVGMIQVSGVNKTLSMNIAGGVGFTAIITSWLAGLSVPVILVVSFLFAAMLQGSTFIQMAFQIPQAAAEIIQGLLLFFVLGSEFFIRYKVTIQKFRLLHFNTPKES